MGTDQSIFVIDFTSDKGVACLPFVQYDARTSYQGYYLHGCGIVGVVKSQTH
jgi:hypothetical protein